MFVFFILLLCCTMATISGITSANANRDQNNAIEAIRTKLLNLTSFSTSQLLDASSDSTRVLVNQIFQLVNEKLVQSASQYLQEAQSSVLQMAMAWSTGDLDAADLDATLRRLWSILLLYPSVSQVGFADAATGNVVTINRVPNSPYVIGLQNSTPSSCRLCLPGASAAYKYYFAADRPGQLTNLQLLQHKPYRAQSRDWYLAALLASGRGAWSGVYRFTSGLGVGCTAVQLVRGPAGGVLGVVGADIDLTFMTGFLREEVSYLLSSVPAPDRPLAAAGLAIAVVDRQGTLLASSTNDSITAPAGGAALPAHWSQAVSNPWLRRGLEAVNASLHGNWSAAPAAARAERGADPAAAAAAAGGDPSGQGGLLARAIRVDDSDGWGLGVVVVVVCPGDVYRGPTMRAVAATEARVGGTAADTRAEIDSIRRRVEAELAAALAAYYALSAAVVVCECLAVFAITTAIAKSLGRLSRRMSRVARLEFDNGAAAGGVSAGERLVSEVLAIGESFKRMEVDLRSFGKYVPRGVVAKLSGSGRIARLGVAPRDASILFSDIRGFTAITESLAPELLIGLLAEYLEAMSSCIEAHQLPVSKAHCDQGTVGKYIGDGIMAFWNSPDEVEDHAAAACAAALAQQAQLALLRAGWTARRLPALHARMGLTSGTVLHGNIGSPGRMEWGLIGDEVNLAARLESMGKRYGVNVLISGQMRARIGGRFLARPIDRVVACGKTAATDVYELVVAAGEATEAQRRYCDGFEAVVTAFRWRDFGEARRLAEAFGREFPGDVAAATYIERCNGLIAAPPGPEWDGAYVLAEK